MGGGLVGSGWRFGVNLRLDGDIGSVVLVAQSGLSMGLEHEWVPNVGSLRPPTWGKSVKVGYYTALFTLST
jgi:hypothetical protein